MDTRAAPHRPDSREPTVTHDPDPYFLAGDEHTILSLHRQVLRADNEPAPLLLRVTSPRTGIAAAHLTEPTIRLLVAALHSVLTETDMDSRSDFHHIDVDDQVWTLANPDHFDPWAAVPPTPAYVTDPGDLEIDRAQTAFADATRERENAAAWLARVHCQHAAYAAALAYPRAAWITIDLDTTNTEGIRPVLVAVLDPEGNPLAERDGTDPVFHALAHQVDGALHAALAIAPNLFTWAGRRSLHLSHYATW